MSDFKPRIARHRDALNELRRRVHATCDVRELSAAHRRAWQDACRELHGFRSEVDHLLGSVNAKTIAADSEIRKFVFDFLSVDPTYFRSGYEKERLLKLLKPLDLTATEQAILHQVIQRRIRNGALRDFRRFCRMIPKIQTDEFFG